MVISVTLFRKNFPNGWECGVPIDGNRDQHLRLEVFWVQSGKPIQRRLSLIYLFIFESVCFETICFKRWKV